MFQKITLFLFLLVALNVKAQISTLVQEYWNVTKVTVNGTDYFPDNAIAPGFLEFQDDIIMGVCDYYSIGFITSIDNSKIYINSGSSTLAVGCTNQPFTDQYPDNIMLTQDLLYGNSIELGYNITHLVNNEYQLIITNQNGDSATYNNHLLSTKNTTLKSVNVYPNPVKNNFFIETKNHQIKQVEIYNLQGKKVKSFKANAVYTIADLGSGIYFAEITTKTGKTTKKIIKN